MAPAAAQATRRSVLLQLARWFALGVVLGALLGASRSTPATASPRHVRARVEGRQPLAGAAPRPPAQRSAERGAAASGAASVVAHAVPAQRQPLPSPAAHLDYNSTKKLKPYTASGDLADPEVLREVVRTRSYRKEMILFSTDASMAGWSYHFVLQLRKAGYEHWIILADRYKTCTSLHDGWAPMVEEHSEAGLSCAYSSFPRRHPGWKQWRVGKGVEDKMQGVYIMWSTRWWVALQLLKQQTNVLSLDIDAVITRDVYSLLRQPPLAAQDVVITRNADQSQSLNCGFVYFNRDAPAAAGAAAAPAACPGAPEAATASFATPAAEWVCELMWERILLFLEVDKAKLQTPPAREVLWEQDAWNDLAKSMELGRRVFPWAVGYGKSSDIWRRFGYKRHVEGGNAHKEKWVGWQEVPLPGMPPWPAPREPGGVAFFASLQQPLLSLPICPPPNVSARAAVEPPSQLEDGIPLGLVSPFPARAGRFVIAPTWLASLGTDPEADWAAATPAPYAYLHLTNMWHCFPHMCWSKAGRLFWLRAHGFWDHRLDETGLTPRGRPFERQTRVLALPEAAFAAMSAVAPTADGAAPPSSARRALAFRRAHALVHNLVLLAQLLKRRPVIPQVPCDFAIAVRPPSEPNWKRSRHLVSHASVIVTGTAEQPICHFMPGTWRPGAPDQCYHNLAMSQFDFAHFERSDLAGTGSAGKARRAELRVSSAQLVAAANVSTALSVLGELCARGAALSAPVLELQGMLPLRDLLLDRPLLGDEFETEAERKASGKPRWRSLLQQSELRQLEGVCPGAAELIGFRKSCCGYFLAE